MTLSLQSFVKMSDITAEPLTTAVPLDGTHLDAVRGLFTKRNSTQERQREVLVR